MRQVIVIFLIALLTFLIGSAMWYAPKLHHTTKIPLQSCVISSLSGTPEKDKLDRLAADAKQFAVAHGLNTQFCFLVDMSIASGKRRFFVYDMKSNIVQMNGLVTHGSCNHSWLTGRQYGNEPGCGCTSLGRYKIGNAYHGRFGLAYKLYGVDPTNSNAYSRFVVLHSMQCVPEKEVAPYPVCQSNGCPAVSQGFLQQLAFLIDKSRQPVLLWIYE